jgi:rhodanese-related sulfurtransferase
MKTSNVSWIRVFQYACVVLALTAAPGCTKNVSDRAITNIAIADAARSYESQKGVLYLDARSAADYAERRIPGAMHIDIRSFDAENAPAAVRQAREIIVYGQDPGSATAIALTKRLLRAGYKRVSFMRDGMNGWVARSLPTEP